MTHRTNILIVEDDSHVLDAVSLMVERLGHHLLRARDGEEAMIMLNAFSPRIQLVLLDWRLPHVLTGRPLIDAMRFVDDRIPIVVMSGFPEEEIRQHLHGLPPVRFLPKPFFPAELARVVKETCLPTIVP